MFTITEQDRQLARRRAEWDREIEDAFGDVISRRHPLLNAPAAEFIAMSSLEQVLEEPTKLLRLRYCRGVRPEHGVKVVFTALALQNARTERGLELGEITLADVKDAVRRFVSEEIWVGNIRGPFRHGDLATGNLTLPGYSYYSLYLHYKVKERQ
jgi:hypothetical protein